MYLTPTSVESVLAGIHRNEYLLPAIQREFVWSADQIRALFDSLLRGYPIGSFLFWKVEPETAANYTFYEFLTHYHQKDHPFAQPKPVPAGRGVTAILDGQQRLTALNVGLYGSHSEKLPRMHWRIPESFPKKRLYVDLLDDADADEFGMVYTLRFLTEAEAAPNDGGPDTWYRVGDVLHLEDSGPAINSELRRRGLVDEPAAWNVLHRLYKSVREDPVVNAFEEQSQDGDRVLDIFVRVNSGGTQLSYSDLLLSMATNQWSRLDAREEIRSLVETLNGPSMAFSFTKDTVLKAGLLMTDVAGIEFRISNFTKHNMSRIEADFESIRDALVLAAELFTQFGFNGRTLPSHNTIAPIAYYLRYRGLGQSYLESSVHAPDRALIQNWLTRSVLKRRTWSANTDGVLRRLRAVIRDNGSAGFPLDAIDEAMVDIGRSLRFDQADLEEIVDLKFGSGRVFSALALLYPGLDLSRSFHEDHIFPYSLFTAPKLAAAGISDDQIAECIDRADMLPNLQLLAGLANIEKQSAMPGDWLNGPHFASDELRQAYIRDNDLGDVPDEIGGFLQWSDMRRQRMLERLQVLLTAPGSAA